MNQFSTESEKEEAIAVALSAIQQRYGLYENNEEINKALERVLEYEESQADLQDTVSAYALIIVVQWGMLFIVAIALLIALIIG